MLRLEEDVGQDDWVGSEAQTFGHGFTLAIKDVKTWVLVRIIRHIFLSAADERQMLILLCIVSSASVTNFFPSKNGHDDVTRSLIRIRCNEDSYRLQYQGLVVDSAAICKGANPLVTTLTL